MLLMDFSIRKQMVFALSRHTLERLENPWSTGTNTTEQTLLCCGFSKLGMDLPVKARAQWFGGELVCLKNSAVFAGSSSMLC